MGVLGSRAELKGVTMCQIYQAKKRMKSWLHFLYCLTILALVISFAGCNIANNPLASLVSTATKTPHAPSAAVLPVATIRPTLKVSPTSATYIMATTTPTRTAASSSLPTLPADEAWELIVELQNTNNGCQLPCYWGFIPGKTLWADAEKFLATFADEISVSNTDDLFIAEVSLSLPKEIALHPFLRQAYAVKNGAIDMIEVQAGDTPSYSLSTFLNTYGPPGEIWIAPQGELVLDYHLFYPQKGILAVYTAGLVTVTDEYVLVCPRNESNPLLVLWSPDVEKSFLNDLINHTTLLGHVDPSELFLFHKIEEVTDIDVVSFYDLYMVSDATACFQIPLDRWPDLRP